MSGLLQRVPMRAGGDAQLLIAPGVLARVADQHAPLMPAFDAHDLTVTGYDYVGDRFKPDAIVDELAAHLEDAVESGRPTVVWGTFIGGMLMVKALHLLSSVYVADDLVNLRLFLLDSPANLLDPVLAPPVPGWLNPVASPLMSVFNPGVKANHGYGRKLMDAFKVPPKDDAIIIPTPDEQRAWHGRTFSDDEFRQMVKDNANEGLSGHKFTMFVSQTQFMLETAKLPLAALDGLDVTYFMCTRANVTVHQPHAMSIYKPFVCEVVEVPTAHCAFREAQPIWVPVITDELGRVLT